MAAKTLPEKTRLARNVREGDEIQDVNTGMWWRVVGKLHVTSPAQFVSFTFEDGSRSTVHPATLVLSRRLDGDTEVSA